MGDLVGRQISSIHGDLHEATHLNHQKKRSMQFFPQTPRAVQKFGAKFFGNPKMGQYIAA
jgi:hypothetical protein